MKVFLFFLTIFLLNVLSCAVTETEKLTEKIVAKDPKDIILKITVEHKSDLDNLRGKLIYFSLYKDGFVEFDDYPQDSMDGKRLILEEVKTLKNTRVSKSELEELKRILTDSKFQNLKNKYEKIVSSCDETPQVEIKHTSKNIKIAWCDNITNPHDSPEFPAILQKLFQKIYKIKSETMNKEVPSI